MKFPRNDTVIHQARSKPSLIGQAILHMSSGGVWGHVPPENFSKVHIVRCNLVHSGGCPINSISKYIIRISVQSTGQFQPVF